ncbi:single-stranded DNA-binding protein (plasmid) [Latilactobacillus curvatus]|uniref:single-stranded DNA-binding protein n=1 Tax=Latilactobacillus curvatus TaxID=28038 RepID=UPI0024BB3124|nr:single-stranded DNA-binding protein [Latilactobacillus curvatus]WHQ77631.1 single-stranded DNA-binding protein [Latilactobacillus curvatus]WHQ78855.1 single-stranded DNA-binding protein [Latilactobacillus curvatus]WHQ79273.1 single-stranded DNA-binding protein [Latilactobacillus curvatus]
MKMNSANLIGNLTRDPELKYSQSGMALMSCNIAVRRQFKDKQSGDYESDFINIKAFGKTAELFSNSFRKGSKVGVTGTIQTGRYENNQGQTVYTTDIIVNSMTFVEAKSSDGGSNSNQTNYTSNGQTGYNKPNNQSQTYNNGQPIDISDDQLPV